jgi:hypothetical protein
MYRMCETSMTIPHADGKEDQIRLILPALMYPGGVEEEKEYIRSLVEGMPMAACLPIKAWLRFLGMDEYAGGLEGENEPISSGPPSGVLHDLAREVERRARVEPLQADTDDAIRPGFCSLHLMEIRGWKKELVRSCCAALRTHDGRASAWMRIERGKVFSLRVLEEKTGREASLLLEFWSLPYVADDVLEIWGLPDGVGRILENWEKIVGKVRYDAGQGLHFVRVGERGEIGFNLRTPDGLRELVDALFSLAEETP